MEDYFMCVVCGVARYRHDVVSIKTVLGDENAEKWKLATSESVVKRAILSSEPVACVEHFGQCNVDKNGTLLSPKVPKKLSEKEVEFVDNYFNDHDYMKLHKEANGKMDNYKVVILKTLFCSVCSESVRQNCLYEHSAEHQGINIDDIVGCIAHCGKNKKRARAKCHLCTEIQNYQYRVIKMQASLCFPQVELEHVPTITTYARGPFEINTFGMLSTEYCRARAHLYRPEDWAVRMICKKEDKPKKRGQRSARTSMAKKFSRVIDAGENSSRNSESTSEVNPEDINLENISSAPQIRPVHSSNSMPRSRPIEREEIQNVDIINSQEVPVPVAVPASTATDQQSENFAEEHVELYTWLDGSRAVRKMILRQFYKNVHPSQEDLSQMMVFTECSFATTYHNFARLRKFYGIECSPSCNCAKILDQFWWEFVPVPVERVFWGTRQVEMYLRKVFAENPFPRTEKYQELADKLNLKFADVQKFYHKERQNRLNVDGIYKRIGDLSVELTDMIIAMGNRQWKMNTQQRIALANQHKVSYITVSYYLDNFMVTCREVLGKE